jgi:ribonuclease VapC
MEYQIDLVIDTSALVAIILNEPDAPQFFERILNAKKPVLSAVGKVETLMVILARGQNLGRDSFDFTLKTLGVGIAVIDDFLAELAVKFFLNYGKGRHKAQLNFGDCFSYALAKQLNVPLLFKGNDFSQTGVMIAL